MELEMRVFKDLLLWVFDSHQRPGEYINQTAQRIWNEIQAFGIPLNGPNLETALPTDEDATKAFPQNHYLYLNPITEDRIMVPRLRLECDFGRSHPHVICYVELYLLHEDHIQMLAYRFESPEGPGIHNYYHMQNKESPSIPWIPTSQPAIVLDANNSVRLLLCLLISLYGLDSLKAIIRDSNIHGIAKYCNDLNSIVENERIIWYWRMDNRNNQAEPVYYETDYDPDEFKELMRGERQGWACTPITKDEYGRKPGRLKEQRFQ